MSNSSANARPRGSEILAAEIPGIITAAAVTSFWVLLDAHA
eukprot:CAMPEP_0175014718 /NCGR_PEP_ID=MMETSP0005-20121125/10741_1 /TAXON_ID=420556 /ORGANISM="Ochromonas sp., Strain CCMP1393" /LENGTH=40 /DNA_ID= /DNA_START= /DNA_END= /DNA_ORIENTATION=